MDRTDTNNQTFDELEQIRADFQVLKNKFEQQEIVNDKLLRSTMSTKVGGLKRLQLLEYLSGIIVIAVSPWAFHFNPSIGASWWFIGATDLMMIFSMIMTVRYNRKVVRSNTQDVNLREFCENVKELRQKWMDWLKIAIPMVIVWLSWLVTETWLHADNHKLALVAIAAMLVGGTVGGIIGNRNRRKIIRDCEEIIAQIDN